jgi:probable sporulation protein (polysaccharide deacetylase family)
MLKKSSIIMILFCILFISIYQSNPIHQYITSIKNEESILNATSQPTPSEQKLYDYIVSEAQRLRIEPIDARVDRVWKAIPGLNGREVDIERTFLLARKDPTNMVIPFIFREVVPDIQLEDLGSVPIYKGNPHKPMISLMINVAWKEENIPNMLQTLSDENVKATFFFLGSWLKDHPNVAKQIAAEGHELANHAYSHANMSELSNTEARQEIEHTQQLIRDLLKVNNQLFAPPSGDYNAKTVEIARELGLYTIMWTLDTIDWKEPHPDIVVKRISARMEPGALILMHPTRSASQALLGIIREAKQRGLLIGTVSQLLSPNRVPEVEQFLSF